MEARPPASEPGPGAHSACTHPDLSFVIPAWNENRRSDLLATLIATDPEPIAPFVGGIPDAVRREVVHPSDGRRKDRLDLLLLRGGRPLAAIEAKVLSDVGVDQLARYREAFSDAGTHLVLHLAQLPVAVHEGQGWSSIRWEEVLDAYTASTHPWVRATARSWAATLTDLVPSVSADTVWNDVSDDQGRFELELRARSAWLANRMHQWCRLDHDLLISSGGGAWVVAMRSAPLANGHRVVAEFQEDLPSISWKPDAARAYRDRLRPVVLVGLAQFDVTDSSTFDWAALVEVFRGPIIDESAAATDGRPWQMTSANPKHPVDRANWAAMVEGGAPRWLGKGYGNATARTHGSCVFGARLTLKPTMTLGQIEAALKDVQSLVADMASGNAV